MSTPSHSKVYYDTYGREFLVPNYTIGEIREAIPAHCFNRDTLRSFSYVLRDFALIACFGYAATYISLIPSPAIRALAWVAYTVIQGTVATGAWVMAHECGHQAFSPSKAINDTVGFIVHSFLLVPYFSWKFSHARHHAMTGHLGKDTVFVPATRSKVIKGKGLNPDDYPVLAPKDVDQHEHENAFFDMVEETPLATTISLVLQQLGGWPMYLFTNVTGQSFEGYSKLEANHFWPLSPLYKSEQRFEIFMSDVGLGIMGYLLYLSAQKFGWANVLFYYVMPYLVVNSNLVGITFLQHTDPALPHYREGEWNFVRGAAATIDREFGFVGKHILHDIIESHVCHHYIARIPFYHGREATAAMKKVMGPHYRKDETNLFVALYRSARMCKWVADDGDVVFFENAHGLGSNSTGHMNRASVQ